MTAPTRANPARRRPAEGPRVLLCQIAPAAGDIERNLERHREGIRQGREADADLVVFGERSLCGLVRDKGAASLAMARDDRRLRSLAEDARGLDLIAGFIEEAYDGKLFSSAAWLADGRIVHVQRKLLLEGWGKAGEVRLLRAGRGVRAFDTTAGRAALVFAGDAQSPMLLSLAVLDGAELVCIPAAVVAAEARDDRDGDARTEQCRLYLRAMARALGAYILFADCAGADGEVRFAGESAVFAPDGSVLACAGEDEQTLDVVLPRSLLRRARKGREARRAIEVGTLRSELARIAASCPYAGSRDTGSGTRAPAQERKGDSPHLAPRYRPDARERTRRLPGRQGRHDDDGGRSR